MLPKTPSSWVPRRNLLKNAINRWEPFKTLGIPMKRRGRSRKGLEGGWKYTYALRRKKETSFLFNHGCCCCSPTGMSFSHNSSSFPLSYTLPFGSPAPYPNRLLVCLNYSLSSLPFLSPVLFNLLPLFFAVPATRSVVELSNYPAYVLRTPFTMTACYNGCDAETWAFKKGLVQFSAGDGRK